MKLLGVIGWPPLGEMVGEVIGEPISGGLTYLLRDTFSTDLAAGSVNGTLADTGQARTVVDANSVLSITGGKASVATGGVAGGNPGLWYPQVTRQNGMILLAFTTPNTNIGEVGWDTAQTGTINFGFRLFPTSSLGIRDNGSAVIVGAAPIAGTEYQLCLILRSTGVWYFVKGGVFTFWTLVWTSPTGAANLFPGFANQGTADVYTVDDIRIPAGVTFIPQPLVYDTFTR